jgi:signal transduction histidine kinase
VGARTLLILLREGDDLVVAAGAGHTESARGQRLPIHRSTSGQVLEQRLPQRVTEVARRLRIDPAAFGVPDASTALLVPVLHRGIGIGVLAAFDHGKDGGEFTDEDERLLRAFAQSAANAVAIKRSVEADRLRSALAAAESERARWARELHDQTLQALGGLRVLLASSVGRGDANTRDGSMRQAIEDIEVEIANLREIIADLRPSLLDDLGLVPALEALLERRRGDALEITSELRFPRGDDHASGLSAELETTVYRLVQESLTNVVKHAHARSVRVSVEVEGGEMVVEVRDDGSGYDTEARASGFGLAGMRERVSLAGGTLTVESGESGTLVQARLPALSVDDVVSPLRNKQAAS